jgi:hypothetical protein
MVLEPPSADIEQVRLYTGRFLSKKASKSAVRLYSPFNSGIALHLPKLSKSGGDDRLHNKANTVGSAA